MMYNFNFGSCLTPRPTAMVFTLLLRTITVILCIKRDSNSYAVRHQVLNLGCLPIPPLTQLRFRPLNRFYITTISFAERFVSFQVTYLLTTLIIRSMVFYIPITTILQIIANCISQSYSLL